MAKTVRNENSFKKLLTECESPTVHLGKQQNTEKTMQNEKTHIYLCNDEQSMKKERLANWKTKDSNDH